MIITIVYRDEHTSAAWTKPKWAVELDGTGNLSSETPNSNGWLMDSQFMDDENRQPPWTLWELWSAGKRGLTLMNHHPLERKNGASSAKMVTLVAKLGADWELYVMLLQIWINEPTKTRRSDLLIQSLEITDIVDKWTSQHQLGSFGLFPPLPDKKSRSLCEKHVMVRDWYHLPSFIHRNKPASWNGRPKRVDFTRIWLANLELSTSQMMGILRIGVVLSYEQT